MKHALILALALCALPAAAEVIATAPNKDGGKIVLTDDACPADLGRAVAFTTGSGGKVSFGCWRTYNGSILVRYTSGAVRMYEFVDFTPSETAPQPTRNGT